MLLYNNLLINGNSDRHQPFLLNIVSGRRRLLQSSEFAVLKNMVNNKALDDEAQRLFDKLIQEKQFYTDEMRKTIEESLKNTGYWERESLYAEDYRFSIELTRSCNMNCSFCYAASRNTASSMSKEHVDAIMAFYEKHADSYKKIEDTPYIRITGGEPLLNGQTTALIQYIADKWKKAKIILFTNGANLLEFYDCLPLNQLMEVHISIDGPPAIHSERRYPNNATSDTIFENIIGGIQQLLKDEIDVKVKTVVDRNNYLYIEELRNLLKERRILDSPHCEHLVGVTLDYHNALDIMDEVNNKQDIKEIETHLETLGILPSTYPGLSIIQQMLMRTENRPFSPKCSRCNNKLLANYFFACNGRVYHCDCIEDNVGVVGTFYPEARLYEEVAQAFYERNIFSNSKCAVCAYKFVCLGGCPLGARVKGEETDCSIFGDEEILDNLEFDDNLVFNKRWREKNHETDKEPGNY